MKPCRFLVARISIEISVRKPLWLITVNIEFSYVRTEIKNIRHFQI